MEASGFLTLKHYPLDQFLATTKKRKRKKEKLRSPEFLLTDLDTNLFTNAFRQV